MSENELNCLMKIISGMPMEFFSLETVNPDREALQSAALLADLVSREQLQQFAQTFLLQQLMEIKATLVSGQPIKKSVFRQRIKGLCNLLLTLSLKYEDLFNAWL